MYWPENAIEIDSFRGVEFSGGRRFFVYQIFAGTEAKWPVLEKEIIRALEVHRDDIFIIVPLSFLDNITDLFNQRSVHLEVLHDDLKSLLCNIFTQSAEAIIDSELAVDKHNLKSFSMKPQTRQEVQVKTTLRELKKLEDKESTILGRNDFTYQLLLTLVRDGGVKSLRSLAKQFLPPKQRITAFYNNVRAYYHYGDPFERIGLGRSEWPVKLELDLSKQEVLRVENLDALVAGYSELGEDVPPTEWIVNNHKYTYGGIIELTRDKSAINALTEPFSRFFRSLPRDAIGRKEVRVDKIVSSKTNELFSIIVRSAEILVSVCIGPKNLDYSAGKREVVTIWETMKRLEREHRFITDNKCFSLLICRDFSKHAYQAISRGYDRVVLISIADFIRLAQFIESLEGMSQQLAIFGLFMLGKIAAVNSFELVEKYKKLILDNVNAISM